MVFQGQLDKPFLHTEFHRVQKWLPCASSCLSHVTFKPLQTYTKFSWVKLSLAHWYTSSCNHRQLFLSHDTRPNLNQVNLWTPHVSPWYSVQSICCNIAYTFFILHNTITHAFSQKKAIFFVSVEVTVKSLTHTLIKSLCHAVIYLHFITLAQGLSSKIWQSSLPFAVLFNFNSNNGTSVLYGLQVNVTYK